MESSQHGRFDGAAVGVGRRVVADWDRLAEASRASARALRGVSDALADLSGARHGARRTQPRRASTSAT
jgi:hypothetical protein